jgi:nicotinate phosphoribosyltransferase
MVNNMKNKMKKYTDKYFLRANQILKAENLNPWVNMQVFVRKGPGKTAGIDEAIDIITNNSNIVEAGGRIYSANEGDKYAPKDTIMNIIAPIQEIVELETVYLGVLAAGITRENDCVELDYGKIGAQMAQIVELAGNRTVLYFGARHWHWNEDQAIAKIAYDNGIRHFATDNGAEPLGLKAGGTIPHALENVFAKIYGVQNAVKEATLAFDRNIDPSVPRIALIDYNNKEITDTILTAETLNGKLTAVRTDTCGENLAEGGIEGDKQYWQGKGVTVEGIVSLRKAMNNHPVAKDVGIALSSGFSNPEKVRAFNEGEKLFGIKLYDMIGAGFLDGVRTVTADIVAVADEPDKVDFYVGKVEDKNIIHKVGRPPRPNYDLVRRL